MSYKDNLIRIAPYTAGEQPDKKDFIKLNANENPYPPAPGVMKALGALTGGELKKYPSADAVPLCRRLAEYYGVPRENVFCGNGSDDVLALAFRAFFNSDKPILFPDITYSFYPVWCDMLRIPFEKVPLGKGFELGAEGYKRENGGIVIANPNAPTSRSAPLSVIEEIISSNPGSVVIVDEAYVDFGGETALGLLEKYENLAVVRTFSKSRSLAGMRIGFAICGRALMDALRAAKDSYNSYPLDKAAIAAGIASVDDEPYFRECLSKLIATRERTAKALRGMGFEVIDSCTNFLFAKHERYTADSIYDMLKAKDIYVRHFNKPGISEYLRISVGTDEEMDMLMDALAQIRG